MPEQLFHQPLDIRHLSVERPAQPDLLFDVEAVLTPEVQEALLRYVDDLTRQYFEGDDDDASLHIAQHMGRLKVLMPEVKVKLPFTIGDISMDIDNYSHPDSVVSYMSGYAGLILAFPTIFSAPGNSYRQDIIRNYLESIPQSQGTELCAKLWDMVDAKFLLPRYDYGALIDRLDWDDITNVLRDWSQEEGSIIPYALAVRSIKILTPQHFVACVPNQAAWALMKEKLEKLGRGLTGDAPYLAPLFANLTEAMKILSAEVVVQENNALVLSGTMRAPSGTSSAQEPLPPVRNY